jgi:hypothetical protein
MSLIVRTKRRPPVAGWIWNARRGTARWTALDIRTPTFRVEEVGRGPAIRTRGLTVPNIAAVILDNGDQAAI